MDNLAVKEEERNGGDGFLVVGLVEEEVSCSLLWFVCLNGVCLAVGGMGEGEAGAGRGGRGRGNKETKRERER